ncbi:MAG TPA: AraC family transcriptional regulator [Burkholderiales bacterium]|nr:AraC family transcriptional regulator [Burkholderiales bacterium]
MLVQETVHRSAGMRVHFVRCRPHDGACGAEEYAPADLLVFPLRGVFVKHHASRSRVVADTCHALLFAADQPYRVSHPVTGGDECLVLEPSSDTLGEILGEPRAAAPACVPLDASLIARRRLLWYRLQRRVASELEAEETALDLLACTLRSPMPRPPQRQLRSRGTDIVEATKLALAAQPGEPWSLGGLARRVYSSPWHLARTFRELAGVPLHRYQLRVRLAAALDEVLESRRDLTTIGIALGFSSHSHFTACFRRGFGVTPSALRRHARGPQIRKILTALPAARP